MQLLHLVLKINSILPYIVSYSVKLGWSCELGRAVTKGETTCSWIYHCHNMEGEKEQEQRKEEKDQDQNKDQDQDQD